MLLWLVTFILGITYCCSTRRSTRRENDIGDSKDHLMKSDDEECAPPKYEEDPKMNLYANPAAVERTPDASNAVLQDEKKTLKNDPLDADNV